MERDEAGRRQGMIRVAVTGAAGRMGSRVIALLQEEESLKLAGAVEREDHAAVGRDAGEKAGLPPLGVPIRGDLSEVISDCEVIIDFTAPAASLCNIELVSAAEKAIVVGTTGFPKADIDRIRTLSARCPCVLSPNMSVGVNILFKVLGEIAPILGTEYDVEIYEAHHRFKKDAPSGTALRMAQIIARALGRDLEDVGVFGRKGVIGERTHEEIGIHTLRAGDIVGEHTVVFGGMGERIELVHRAQSRDNFARGALRAAKFAAHAGNGVWDMLDVLGLK
jgi:4-hydroxy-tetrahydrodipicolinate reductase